MPHDFVRNRQHLVRLSVIDFARTDTSPFIYTVYIHVWQVDRVAHKGGLHCKKKQNSDSSDWFELLLTEQEKKIDRSLYPSAFLMA